MGILDGRPDTITYASSQLGRDNKLSYMAHTISM